MIKFLSRKKILITVLCAFFIVSLSLFFISTDNVSAEYTFRADAELKQEYYIGDTVVVPTETILIGDDTITMDFLVTYPNGNRSKEQNIVLYQNGRYVIKYFAFLPGTNEYVSTEKVFSVSNELFSVEGKGSVEYMAFNGQNGLKAEMYNGDILKYNNILDLNNYADMQSLFKFFIYPQVVGEEDFTSLNIVLTDIYDENIFVMLKVNKSQEDGEHANIWTYSMATFDKVHYAGVEIFNTQVILHTTEHGTPIHCSYTGTPFNGTLGDEYLTMSYDAKEMILRLGNQESFALVADLNDVAMFTDVFKGFTDNKVKISFVPNGFSKSKCALFFTEFAGMKISDSKEYIVDTDKPHLDVEFGDYSETTIPNAIINKKYKIFAVNAFDEVDGYLDYDVNVYYGYNNVNKITVDVIGGEFIPTRKGVYTIEYRATDLSGNTVVKTVQITAVQQTAELQLEINNLLSSYKLGESKKLFDGYSITNNNGIATLIVVAENTSDSAFKYYLNEKNNYIFTPLKSGEYRLKFIYSDYVDAKEKQEYITVVNDEDIVSFDTNVNLPKYLIKNAEYDFPDVKMSTYKTGEAEVSIANVFVKEDDGEFVKLNGIYKVNADRKVIVRFCETLLSQYYFEKEMDVVDAGFASNRIDISSYFVATVGQVNFTANNGFIECEVLSFDENAAEFTFVNILSNNSLYMKFLPLIKDGIAYSDFKEFSVFCYDSLDDTKYVKFTFSFDDENICCAVNDGMVYNLESTFNTEEDYLLLDFNAKTSKVIFNEKITLDVKTYYNGERYNGFEFGTNIYCSFKAKDAGQYGIGIENINGQLTNDITYDSVAPTIVKPLNQNGGEHFYGEKIVISPCLYFDVLSPLTYAKLEIISPSENFVEADDGTLIDGQCDVNKDYSITLTEFGSYLVTYYIEDYDGNKAEYTYSIFVINNEKPEITLKNGYDKTGEVGEKIKIAAFTYSLKETNVKAHAFITVKKPNAQVEYIVGNSFTPTKQGVYVVSISVLDANGNMATVSYEIVVK